MYNFIAFGRYLTVPAPAGGATVGHGVLIGALFGVAQSNAAAGNDVEILTEGVVEIAKAPSSSISIGDVVFWNDLARNVDNTSTSNSAVGIAVENAAFGIAVCRVKIGAFGGAGGGGHGGVLNLDAGTYPSDAALLDVGSYQQDQFSADFGPY